MLDLLGRAFSAPWDSTGARRATTSDGRVEIVPRQPDANDPDTSGGWGRHPVRAACMRTSRGELWGPDYVVDVHTQHGGGSRAERGASDESPTNWPLSSGRRCPGASGCCFGSHCPPLVCTSGWPNSAAVALLRQLEQGGAALRYHGDFDGEGLRIAAYVRAKTSAVPWHMTAADYLSAAPPVPAPSAPSPGRVTQAPWGPDLAQAIAERDVAVLEESVADALLDELAEQHGNQGA